MKTTSQFSKDNPGWSGRGVPSRQRLGILLFRDSYHAMKKGQIYLSFIMFYVNLVNLYRFTVDKNKKDVECVCCGWQGPAFISVGTSRGPNMQSRCPICDSRSRHRGLARLLPVLMKGRPGEVLVFAPENVLLNVVDHLKMNYQTTDLYSSDVDLPGEDIQSLSFADNSYDWIICNHVLEHVPDDKKGMRECFRVIKPGGIAIFTIPGNYKNEKTEQYSDLSRNGHYRNYGRSVCKDFAEAGFTVDMIDMGADQDRKWGIRSGDMAFICSKGLE